MDSQQKITKGAAVLHLSRGKVAYSVNLCGLITGDSTAWVSMLGRK